MIREATEGEVRRREAAALAVAPGSAAEAAASLLACVRRLAARALEVEAAALPPDRSLIALGLDSLAAAELAGALADELGVAVPFSDLLAGPTLAELCSQVSQLLAGAAEAGRCAVQPVPAAGMRIAGRAGGAARGPLSHGQLALWLLDRMTPGNPSLTIAGAARVRGALDVPRLHGALAALVARHASLRTTFAARDGERGEDAAGGEAVAGGERGEGEDAAGAGGSGVEQVVHEEAAFAFVEEDAAGWSEERLLARLAAEAERPFDLARGPLLRVAVFRRRAPAAEPAAERAAEPASEPAAAAGDGHLLVLAVHHIVADFWSLGVLLGELGTLLRGEALPPLPAASYLDFSRWQAERLAGPEGERLWSFWRAALLPRAPPIELPTDRPRPPLQGFRGGSRGLRLAGELALEVQALGNRAGATPFMTLVAAFLALLYRTSGQEELLVGTPTAGRGAAELAGLVGYLVNPVVLRGDLGGNPTFAELLRRVRREAVAAFAHQDLPFPLLAERLGGERDPSRSPIFQVMFALYRERRAGERGLGGFALGEGGASLDLGGLALEAVALPRHAAQFDLSLAAAESGRPGSGIGLSLRFNGELFDAATILRLLAHFRALLAGILAAPERPLRELALCSAAERHQLTIEWSTAGLGSREGREGRKGEESWEGRESRESRESREVRDGRENREGRGSRESWSPGDGGLVHLPFERRAASVPAAVAVVGLGGEAGDGGTAWMLTYGELERRANRLAGTLRAMGLGPEQIAGICAEPCGELVIGLLAILKTGAAYLPLDPTHPRERLAQLVAAADVRLVLADAAAAPRLAGSAHIVPLGGAGAPAALHSAAVASGVAGDLGEDAADGADARHDELDSLGEPAARREPAAHPDNAAYVIYTSGSTGAPKGVVVPHRAVVNRLRFQVATDLAPGARVLQRTRLAFDVAVVEIFAPLWASAAVVLTAGARQQDAAYLARRIAAQRVTNANLPPALLPALLAEPAFCRARPLRRVVTGGERVPGDLPARFFAAFTAADGAGSGDAAGGADRPEVPVLVSRYGPSEATVSVAEWICTREPEGRSVPLGRPIAGARFHLLDLGDAGQPAPAGLPGELAIGGDCLARGYLGRPDLTAAAFRPDPFARRPEEAGERLYHTGDLARWRADGVLEFLGRSDRQVKVRGFRVELGEIEAVLARHPAVRQAAVVDREEPVGGGRRLVAYVAASAGGGAVPGADGVDGAGASADGAGAGGRRLHASVRAFLEERLPAYMLPATLVVMPALPLTANGKVDRRALPEPEEWPSDGGAPFVAPQGAIEEVLAGIWAGLLGRERIGAGDDFFALGGHSLLATRLVSRLRAAFGVELALLEIFAHPVLGRLAARVEAARREDGALRLPPITPAARDGELPLSFAQERLWFLDQLDPGNAAYNLAAMLRLRGDLRPAALAAALLATVRRHEALRTTFGVVAGKPVQVIAPAELATLAMPAIDLAMLPGPRQGAESDRLARQQAGRPFDLARGPLLRAVLLRLGAADHLLLFAVHHIACDGWSIAILTREVAASYGAALGGPTARRGSLSELAVQYADFACWQRAWLTGEALARQLACWRRRLAGFETALELPADRQRLPVPEPRGARRELRLSAERTASLRQAARREGATLFMLLLGAFQAVLARQAQQLRLVVGTPIANRDRAETEGLIGFFVNLLALAGDLGGEPAWRDLIARDREVCLEAYAHQDLPFEKLVEELAPRRDLAHSPLFQVMLVLQNTPKEELSLPGLEVSRLEIANQTARFELTLTVTENGSELAAVLGFRTALFDGATATRWLGHFERALGAMAADRDGLVWAAPLLAEAELAQLVVEWNDTGRVSPADPEADLGERFALQAARTPGAPAVRCEERCLTYRELAERSARLAARLRRLGVGPEVAVGLLAEPSAEAIVGLLGVLAAGGAYVPLDPGAPAERLAAMLEDAGISILLTGGAAAARLAPVPDTAGRRLRLVALEGGPAPGAVGVEPCDPSRQRQQPRRRAGADNLAYVLYTSGSTGRPKGVAITHRAVVNYAMGVAERLGGGPGASFALVQPLTVDSSVTAIFPPLLTGGCLHVVPRERALDARALAATFARHPVDCLKIAPSHLAALGADAGLLPRRWLIVGGEASQLAWLRRLAGAAPACAVFNHYGPTEATVGVLMHRVGPERGEAGAGFSAAAPVGRPLANARAHLLDERLLPVPRGSVGRLYIGGACLARGYLGRPELTAEVFVPDPFSALPGARLYDSGDLMRSTAGGDLVFVGRRDQQVKIRGFRVELGEIEAAIARHPAVREVVVRTWEEAPGRQALAAWVVARGGAPVPTPAELRRFLAAKLPEHMAPAAVVALDALPRTPHGKLDAKALPAPSRAAARGGGGPAAAAAAAGDRAFAGARSPVAELVAGIWGELLGPEAAGAAPADGFFELGGHSLLATQLVSRLRAVFGVDLALREVFEHPTLADLAGRVEAAQRAAAEPALRQPAPPLVRAPRDGPLPLSFAQQRLWFLAQLEPGSALYNVPVAVAFDGPLDAAALGRSLDEIVRRHEVLRTRFPAVEGQPAQWVDPWSPVPLPVVDLGGIGGNGQDGWNAGAGGAGGDGGGGAGHRQEERLRELVRREVRREVRRPFDLAAAPPLRRILLRLGERRHALLATMHHIAADAWSRAIFERELDHHYRRRSEPLPELAVQYADYAAWQRGWLAGELLAAELAHWRGRLGGAPPLLELPADRPRTPLPSHRGAFRRWSPPAPLVRELAALARRGGATLFMALLAVFQAVLARWSGQQEVSVGTPIAGRNRLETEALVGCFVNTLVLRTGLGGDPGFGELLARVREVALDAYLHQDLPFEKLVEELAPERNLSHSPLFQVMFVLENVPGSERAPAGLPAGFLAAAGGTAKFDLTLGLRERGGTLAGGVEYATDLFDAATVTRLCGHFEALLAGAAAGVPAPVDELPLLSVAELHQVAREINVARAGFAPAACLHALFAAQVERRPDAVAVACGEERLTYRELDRRAERWAAWLRARGVGPEVRVGILLERSLDLVVSILAVLAAGGAYVPLDPGQPAARAGFILADSAVAVLLTDSRLAAGLPPHGAAVLCVDSAAGDTVPEQGGAVPAAPAAALGPLPENLAYVIYTSGSTGAPKGVMVTHGQAVRLFSSTAEWFGFDERDVWTLFHSAAFDFSVWEFWGALLHGGRLVVVPYWVSRAPEAFDQLIQREAVTVLSQTPSAFRQLVQAGDGRPADSPGHAASIRDRPATSATSLRTVVLGGEALEPSWLPPWFERHGAERPRLVNMYGITETTVHVTWRPLRPSDATGASMIGCPLPDLGVCLLDRRLQPVPLGVAGEIHVAGAGLARGYLDRPALTAERFVPHPFGRLAGERLYRSGDLARLLPSGDLEYLSRADQQVKVRGFRIEPGEIEAVLMQHPGVCQVAVLATAAPGGGKRLAACVVAGGAAGASGVGGAGGPGGGDTAGASGGGGAGGGDTAGASGGGGAGGGDTAGASVAGGAGEPALGLAELRAFAQARLPEYMVPARFLLLPALPLTANGKIDRRALAARVAEAAASAETGRAFSPPRNAAESALAEVWAETLGIERVGIDDGFFALGGDSISSLRLRARAAGRGIHFPLQALFRHPTIRELLATAAADVSAPGEAQVEVGGATQAFDLVTAADRASLRGAIAATSDAGGVADAYAGVAGAHPGVEDAYPGVEDAYPITALQLGMFFHSELSPGAAAYHNVAAVRLRLPFDAGAMRAALRGLAARHPVLRTSFHPAGFAEPLQLVHREIEIPLLVIDLRGLAAAAREAALARWFERARHERLDLARAPLLRFELLRLARVAPEGRDGGIHGAIAGHRPSWRAREEIELGLIHHHAILDGWSVASLIGELFGLYFGILERSSVPPAPPALFRTFVGLEREAVSRAESRHYWQETIAERGWSRLPSWPGTAARGDGGRRGVVADLVLPLAVDLSVALAAQAAALAVPLKSVLLAAHLKVCALATGQDDVLTGLVSNGRPEVEGGEQALGLFLNTVPLRLRLGHGSWSALVRRTFAAEIETLPHRRFPLAELQRTLGRQPLVEVAFTYLHFHVLQRLAGDERVEILDVQTSGATNFPLDVTFVRDPRAGALTLALKFDRRQLAWVQVERLARSYAGVLAAMLRGDAPHAEHAALDAAERHQLVGEWNDTAAPLPGWHGVHQRFAAQAARTPDRAALRSGASVVSYAELDARAGELAAHLRVLGIGPERRVGILLPRSPGAVVAVLAALTAGGAYVPLDPALPAERLGFLIEDCGIDVLVTETGLAGRLGEVPASRRAAVVTIDTTAGAVPAAETGTPATVGTGGRSETVPAGGRWASVRTGGRPASAPRATAPCPGNLAYVLYTSGSSGRPKGVMVSHAALAHYLEWSTAAYLGTGDGGLSVDAGAGGAPLHTSLSFDLSVTSLLAPLLAGREVVLVPEQAGIDGLAHTLAGGGFGFVKLTPAHLDLLAQSLPAPRVRGAAAVVVVGGEQLHYRQLGHWREHAPACLVVNEYGPTEAAVGCAVHAFRAGDCTPDAGAGAVPIGRPIANTRLFLLDADCRPVPILAEGELFIGGGGLARGYLGRPDLTAERFVPDPVSGLAGERLYRTGDICRLRADGNLELLRRADRQVKLRGFRVEPGEIEAVLGEHPAVRAAAVIAREDEPGDRRLAAYVVTAAGAELDAGELRSYLRARLPEPLVPADYMALPALPLTRHGKVDRQALPRPDRALARGREAPVAPRDDLERRLVAIWEEALGVVPVGIADSFFDLGGHSLLAVRLMAAVEERCGRRLPISTLFEAATIERLAGVLRAGQARTDGESAGGERAAELAHTAPRRPSTLVAIEPGRDGAPFYCVHPIGGSVLCYRELARQLGTKIPFYGLQAPDREAGDPPPATIEEMAHRHLESLRGFQPSGPYHLGGWSMGAAIVYEMAQQLARQADVPALVVLIDPAQPGDEHGQIEDATLTAWFVEHLRSLGLELGMGRAELGRLAPEEVLRLACARAGAAGPPARELAAPRLRAALALIESNGRALLRYRPQPYPGPLTIFSAEGRAAPELQAAWSALAQGGVELHRVAGDHYTMLRPPLVAGLAARLRECLLRGGPEPRAGR